MLVFKTAPNIGHYSVKDFLCPAAVKTLPVIMTNDFNFVDISFFLLVHLWQVKTFDFINFTSCNHNIEMNEHKLFYEYEKILFYEIFKNKNYSILLKKLVITLHSLFVWRNVFLDGWNSSLFWPFTVWRGTHFPAFELVHWKLV